MNTTVLAVGLILLIWPFLRWLQERRLRRFAEARLRIAQSVSKAETLMLHGDLKLGDACHDHVFDAMYQSQFFAHFPLPRIQRSEEGQRLSERIREEFRQGESPFVEPVRQFVASYVDAMFSQNLAIYLAIRILYPVLAMLLKGLRLIGFMRRSMRNLRAGVAANSLAIASRKPA